MDRQFSRSFGAFVFNPFWPLGGPLDRGGGKKNFLRQPFFTKTKLFKFGYYISSRLRDIDEKRALGRKREKKRKRKKRRPLPYIPFLLRKRSIIIKV